MNTLPKEKFVINKSQGSPAAGGANTHWDKVQIGLGDYSNVENTRVHGTGFKLRPGLVRHHTTDLGEVLSLYSYKKGARFFAQLATGDVQEATDSPPTATAGAFGTAVLDESALNTSGTGTIRPGSWSQIRDNILFSQGKMQHAARPADDAKPLMVIFTSTSSLERMMDEETADITDAVTDDGSSSVSDTLTFTVANDDSLFICTEFPAEDFYFDIQTLPTGTTTLAFSYFDGDDWTVQSAGVTDGTSAWQPTNGDTDGTYTALIASRTSELPTVMFGQSGYWYRFELGSSVAQPTISFNSIYYNAPFRLLENVMSPLPEPVIEAQVEMSTGAGELEQYAASAVNIGELAAGAYVYFSTTDPSWALYAEVGTVPKTAPAATIYNIDAWTGAWTSVTGVEDASGGLKNTGYITWDRTSVTPVKRSFNGSRYRAYWYRIRWDQTMKANMIIGLSTLFYFDISKYGQVGEVSTSWKQRGCFTFSKFPRDIYVSQKDRPNILNGSDYGILTPGDGRYNRVTAMLSFYNELMVFQLEEGSGGGCITLFEGYSPTTWGRLLLSTRLGTFSQSCVCILDAATDVTRTTDVTQTLVAFISKYGIFVTDGKTIQDISGPIRNYFDPENDEYIDVSASEHHWISYDRAGGCLRVGLQTIGATVDAPDVFPVYHLSLNEWTFDTYSDALPTAFAEVTAGSGDVDSLQYLAAKSASSGGDLIYRCNASNDYDEEPDGTKVAVAGKVVMELSNSGNYLEIRELVVRLTSNANYTLTKKVYENGTIDSDETETFNMADPSSGSFYRNRLLHNVKLNHQFSVELGWQNTGGNWGESPRLYDYIYEIYSNTGIA